jgi:mxaD protein
MRKGVAAVCGLLCSLSLGVALADAPEQSIFQTISIDAPPDAVWAVAGDFVGLPKWYPPAESARLVLGRNNVVGCIRELTRRNGTKVTERLIDYDPWNHRLEYTYADGQVMSSDYFAVLQVKDAGGGKSTVEWKARFKRLAYWTDEPAGPAEEAISKALNTGYRAGLENLKKIVEAGGQ